MKTHWVFNNCEEHKQSARALWDKKHDRIERLLKRYDPELCELHLTLYYHENRNFWELRAVLYLPTGTLAAHETKGTMHDVINIVADELAREIKRHKELVRKDYLYRRRRKQRQNLSAAGPLLGADVARNRREAFFNLLRPYMKSVRDHAERELSILEINGTLPAGEVTADDLVDDVMVRAFEQFEDRPAHLELDVWLIDLLHQRLDELVKKREPVLLSDIPPLAEDEPLTPPEDVDEQAFWLSRLFEREGPLTIEDLIPDCEATEAWESLSKEEQKERLQQALGRLPVVQREALLLHALEGFETSEIAMIQDRDEADVVADIQQARQKLAEELFGVSQAEGSPTS